jgi:lysophospholipase L1-like esterase
MQSQCPAAHQAAYYAIVSRVAMRVLMIGGSNLVINNGIASILPTYLSTQFECQVEEFVNIAVPGSGSLFGLHNLLALGDVSRFDIVFIEYGINDYPLHSRNPTLWQRGFSGLLREVRQRCVKAAVVLILLGRRDKKFFSKQRLLHEKMRAIASQAGVEVADIDTFFKSDRMASVKFQRLYLDGNHFRVPVVTNLIASQCMLAAVKARTRDGDSLPRLDDATPNPHFARFDSLRFRDIAPRHEATEFKNSRYELTAVTLRAGTELSFQLDAYPCAVSFISTNTSGSLLIEVDGKLSIIHTLHRRVGNGEFNFLLRHNPFYWMDDELAPRSPGRVKVKMRLIGPDDAEWDSGLIRPSYEMVPARVDEGAVVHLVGLSTIAAGPQDRSVQ